MQKTTLWLLALAVGLSTILLGAPQAVQAQGDVPEPTPSDDAVNAIAKDMFCPVCENIPLDVCGTQACAQWREQIREKLAEGWTEEEIKDYFVQLYGDRVLAEPPRRGLNWLIYILPPMAFLAGAYVLYRGFRIWRRPLEEAADSAPMEGTAGEQDEYVSQLEEALKNRK